jgi:hypothetical protein
MNGDVVHMLVRIHKACTGRGALGLPWHTFIGYNFMRLCAFSQKSNVKGKYEKENVIWIGRTKVMNSPL